MPIAIQILIETMFKIFILNKLSVYIGIISWSREVGKLANTQNIYTVFQLLI